MRLSRNSYVIGGLVALALVLMFFQTGKKPPAAAAAPTPPKKTKPLMEQPEVSIDVPQAGWVQSPRRELFRFNSLLGPTNSPPVEESLVLKAVWLQDSGNWAVINGKVVGEGEAILDFQVEKILADKVWVQGPGGRKSVGFKAAAPLPSQPASNDVGSRAPKPAPGQRLSAQSSAQVAGKLSPEAGRPGGKFEAVP